MSQISFSDLVNGTIPDASDFNDRFNALKNRINNGMEADNIATGAITSAKIGANAVDASKLDETDDYTWTGVHDFSGATLTGVGQVNGMVGSYKNLVALRASVTTVDVDADFIIVWDSSNRAKLLSSVNLTGAITSSGANGLDTGTEASGTWYYIWVIYNGSAAALLLSTSSTSPTLPSGYTYKALVSAVRNDGSSNFVNFKQNGNVYSYVSWQSTASGNVGTGSWVSIDTTAYIPSALSDRGLFIGGVGSGYIAMVNDNSIDATTNQNHSGRINIESTNPSQHNFEMTIITANTIYWQSGYANGVVYCEGFLINKLG